MMELQLPFLAPSCLGDKPPTIRLSEARWGYGWTSEGRPYNHNNSSGNPNGHGIRSDVTPKDSPTRSIIDFYGWFRKFLHKERDLYIPTIWKVFKDVPWDNEYMFPPADTDSSATPKPRVPDPSKPQALEDGFRLFWGNDSDYEYSLTWRPNRTAESRFRSCWDLLTRLPPVGSWYPQTYEGASRRHSIRHAGDMYFNQGSLNEDIWPQVTGSSIFHSIFCDQGLHESTFSLELACPYTLGRQLAGAIATENFPLQQRCHQLWAPGLSILAEEDIPPDYSCRVNAEDIGWPSDLAPLLFTAQYRSNNATQAEEALAIAFHPMMILFILYYLDTRTSVEEPMPSWMVLFGMIYDERGLILRAHHPSVKIDSNATQLSYGWGATAWPPGEGFMEFTFADDALFRGIQLLALLNRLQGHCRYVFERLKAWEGFRRACAQFIV